MPTTIDIVPEMDEQEQKYPEFTPTDEEEKRGKRVHKRIAEMLEARAPYEPSIQRGLLLYDGILLLDPKQKSTLTNDNLVSPFARMFVEAKTSEEVQAFSEYVFTPVEDSGDNWKVELLKEVNKHVQKVVKQKSKRHAVIRQKNITGVGIVKVGYRRVMGLRKIRIEDNEFGDILKWKEVPVPVYDDIFMDVVSPLNFAIDPNATSMDDAMDCVHFHYENYENFWEVYHNDEKFRNTEKVKAGVMGKFGDSGFVRGSFRSYAAQENMVLIAEYYNKIRDEWCVYANGIEIYYGPLPDDHKELPFVSYHNSPSFCTGFIETSQRTASGEEVSTSPQVKAEETFWTQGDPQTIMDLIELRTLHGRAAHRAIKRASQVIIATEGNYSLPNDQKWLDGSPARGALGKVQVMPLGIANVGNWEWAHTDLFQQMILATAVDPRNLSDTKQKTATESAIQRETSMRRLMENIEFNEENGEVRLGMLTHKLIQQRYTKPEIVRLLGSETTEDLSRFDEVEKDADTGKPIYGKRYRRIKASYNIKESENGKMLSKDDAGVSSFIARPEYIRTSDIDISVDSARTASKIQALEAQQALDGLQIVAQLLPLTQKDPMTGESIISPDDLPSVKELSRMYVKARGFNMDTAMGQQGEKKDEFDKKIEDFQKAEKAMPPLIPPMQVNGTTTGQIAA